MPVATREPDVLSGKKLFYKINEVSKATGLKPYVLRYWETEFPQLSPEKDDNDQRRYRREDIELVLKIKNLLYEEKFTIAGAKQRIASEASGRKQAGKSPKPNRAVRTPAPTGAKSSEPRKPAADQSRLLSELAAIRSEIEDVLSLLR